MKHPFPKDFYYSLVSFLLQAKQQVIAVAGEFGLTGVQALTLLTLRSNIQRSMSDFCSLYNCDASNITGIIDGLEQKDLVSRQPHPNDRRIKLIHLEPAGVDLQNQLINRIAEVSPHLFSGLTVDEAHELARLIQKIQPAK